MRHLSRPLSLWVLLLLAGGPGMAVAEELSYCEEDRRTGEERGHEVEHRVEARPEGDGVRFTVHRTFHNPRPRHTELEALLVLPRGGTVHGLALESQGQWTEGLLLEASQAERRYEALRRKGSAAPRAIALLSSEAGATVRLRLWNLPPRASVTVRYEVRARLAYAHVRIPAMWNTRSGRSGTPVPEQAEQSERQRRWPGFTSPPSWTGSNSFPGRAPSRP
ncbi:MAG TPA: VIT domain-containing protein [Archangium sp.]|uniref:VIT domain-containing protein n=1 Tax=Archangium sp. TaxID=1872627 RepID=UPI002E36B7D1|nr:VIT domain-containing protein [Archangium sp.]HEX5752787.1 VIT domain-containing protein [Archangium sp.]